MKRILFALVLLAVTFPAISAAAPVRAAAITISASRTTIAEGESVVISGHVSARPGSVVWLQRRASGTWTRVKSRKIGTALTYAFTVTPPRDLQRYRVVKPRQLGQARRTSAAVTVTVTWRPVISISTVSSEVIGWSTGAVTTSTEGITSDLPAGTELRREARRADGQWGLDGTVTISPGGAWSDRFASSDGQRFRYVAPRDGARLRTTSTVFVVDGHWTPTLSASASLDPLTAVATAVGESTGLSAGASIELQASSGGQWYDVGSTVVADDGTFSSSFEANMGATYRFLAPASGLRRSATSPPFQIGQPAPARIPLNTTTSVTFPKYATQRNIVVALDQGQAFTYHGPSSVGVTVTDPSGDLLPGSTTTQAATATAPETGDYTIALSITSATYARTVDITISTPVVVAGAIDAPPVDLAGSLPGQAVDLRFDGTDGAVISEYARVEGGDLTLLDPTGGVVPRLGTGAPGIAWRLPATGTYTLRVTFPHETSTSTLGVELLSASVGTMILDGAPAQVTLDRPGRVAVVSVHVPAGLDVRISDTGSVYKQEELFGPDGQLIPASTTSPDISPTVAGTYTQLVGDAEGAQPSGQVAYYARTPVEVQSAVGATTSFDVGAAPDQMAMVRFPVSAGQLLTFEVLDSVDGLCPALAGVKSGETLLDWIVDGRYHPAVLQVAQSGELALRIQPCSSTGTVRITPTTLVTPTLTSSTIDSSGYTLDTYRASLARTSPGQVMLVEMDAGSAGGSRLDMSATASTFPGDTRFSLSWGRPTASPTQGVPGLPWDSLSSSSSSLWGSWDFYIYAGPTATGTLDLEFHMLHQ